MSREIDRIDAALAGTGWTRGMGLSGSQTWGNMFAHDASGSWLALRVVHADRGGPSRSKAIELMINRIRSIPSGVKWYGNEYYDQGTVYQQLTVSEMGGKSLGGNWWTGQGEAHVINDSPEALAKAIINEPGRFGMPNDSPHATVHEAIQAGEDVQDVLHAAGIPEMITERSLQHEAAADALDVMQTTSSPAEASTGADEEGSSPMRGILIVGGILVLVLVVAGVAVGVSR